MKMCLFLVSLVFGMNCFAQTPVPRDSAISSSSTAVIDVSPKVACCAKCAGPNAVLNPALQPPTCRANGESGWQVVYVKECRRLTIQNHGLCKKK